ncbi:MAG: O-methyltransferase, partial [Candidatus Methylomirabilaceae bacterium]
DTVAILRRIYGDRLLLHHDLYDQSNVHRKQHGEGCTVHPSHPSQAPLWTLLAGISKARRFLEVGCGLGYTAALMAEAGGTSAHVDTIESVSEHAGLAEAEFFQRGLADRIHVLRGQAREVLRELTDPYDIIFLDASWREYPQFLPHLVRLTRPGGMLVTANLFPLFEAWAQQMPHKEAVEEYLTLLVRDIRFRTYIIPEHWHALSYRMI